ncbi:MAG: hypothetical protein QOH49_267 [Acidobacteriota bacterium]|jgi:hypothetical protein|nr:hypothetical protein [Acidobacteriota bacterium]
MTAALSLDVRRRAPLSKEELRQQLLALVLAFVLVWYTLVVPASTAGSRRFEPDDEGHDGEVRGITPQPARGDSEHVEDLDWPEYIYP